MVCASFLCEGKGDLQFDLPVDSNVSADSTFQPSKIVIDTAGRVYCIATSINQGLCKYEADGTFSGFVGEIGRAHG